MTPAAARLYGAVLATLLTCLPLTAHSETRLPADQVAALNKAISSFRAKTGIPGVSVAIVLDDQIVFEAGQGMADLENSVPATDSTVYRIASTTKPITAVAAMQLAEKAKLDLDAPVQNYVPSFPTKAYPITTRQVLAHLSGIRHYRQGEGERTDHFGSVSFALQLFKEDPLLHEPETKFQYTTFGYTLLGAIVEGASEMTFEDYLKESLFQPAGMDHTTVDNVYEIIPNRARGYSPRVYGQFDGNVRNADLMDSSYKLPGGGLLSTAGDLARFAIAVQNGVLLKPETFTQMTRNQKTADGKETGYGYGWYVGQREGREPDGSVWHGGVQAGFTADLWILPGERFAVAILTNLEGGGRLGLATLGNELAAIVLD